MASRTKLLALGILFVLGGCPSDELGKAILKIAAQPVVAPSGFVSTSVGNRYRLAAAIVNTGFDDASGPIDVEMKVIPNDKTYCLIGDEVLEKRITLDQSIVIKGTQNAPPSGGAIVTPAMTEFTLKPRSELDPCGLDNTFTLVIVVDPDDKRFTYTSKQNRTFYGSVTMPKN